MSNSDSKAVTSYTAALTKEQVTLLKEALVLRGFDCGEKPYAIFAASSKAMKVQVTVYEKGPKVLVQGKGTAELVEFLLEPEILGEAKLGYEEELQPEMFSPHFGIDESGKGDFFGPLVIAGVYTDREIARKLSEIGVTDSKKIGSDQKILGLAEQIRRVPGVAWEVIAINPLRYNELYKKFNNLNRLLAWGHAKVIENLLEKRPDCPRALSDQFANTRILKNAVRSKSREIEIQQRTKAESDLAVAAASILAREAFVRWLEGAGAAHGVVIPKGASPLVKACALDLVSKSGVDVLKRLAKLHFRTAAEVAPGVFDDFQRTKPLPKP